MRNDGAAHKNQKRRGVLIALRAHRHLERSREIPIAEWESTCMRHFLNDVFVLRLSTISHLLLTGVQERSLDFARDDDTWEAVLTSNSIPNPCFQTFGGGGGGSHMGRDVP